MWFSRPTLPQRSFALPSCFTTGGRHVADNVTRPSFFSCYTTVRMTTFTNPACVKRARIESVDLLRGVIMILMPLDHTPDFFGTPGVNPTAPARTTVALFFTRCGTHFCTPVVFVVPSTAAR